MMKIAGVLVLFISATGCASSDGGDSGKSNSSSGGTSSSSSGSSSGASSSSGSTSSSSSSSSGSTPTKKEIGGQCKESADCKDDFCVFLNGGGQLGMCTKTCADDIDCPGFSYKCAQLSDAPQKVCVPN